MYQAYRQYGVPVSTIFSHIHGLRNGPIGSHQHLRADEQAALDDAHVAARRSIENGAPLVRLRIRATLTGTQTRAAYEHGAVMRRDGESMRRCLEELITIEQRSAPFCDTELAVERVAHRADLETLVAGFAASAFEKRSMVRCFSSAQAERVVAAYCARTQQQFELVSSEAVKPGLYDRIPARSNRTSSLSVSVLSFFASFVLLLQCSTAIGHSSSSRTVGNAFESCSTAYRGSTSANDSLCAASACD